MRVPSATPNWSRWPRTSRSASSPKWPARLGVAPKQRPKAEHEARSLRFNDTLRTLSAQLPEASYVAVRACLEARARTYPSDGETGWDHRLADALVEVLTNGSGSRPSSGGSRSRLVPSPFVVVAHTPLEILLDARSELCAELERGGLISAETLRRLACDATLIVAVDDDVGHTLYEGRATRDPSETQRRELRRRDRHCRFPGCANATFTNAHHLDPWTPRGPTDLPNLVLLCAHHHHRVHAKEWKVSGNANEELQLRRTDGPGHGVAALAAVDEDQPAPMIEGSALSLSGGMAPKKR